MACGLNLQLGWDPVARVVRTRDVRDTVTVEDAVHLDVKLLPVLDDATLRGLLGVALRDQGWTLQPDGSLTREFGEAVATLAPDGKAVTLRLASAAEVTATGTTRGPAGGSEQELDARAGVEAASALERASAKERERLARVNLAELTAQEPAVRAELQGALNRTYRRALEQRARELGEVESVREAGDAGAAGGSYEVTVVVRA